jgi:hypothetical protein
VKGNLLFGEYARRRNNEQAVAPRKTLGRFLMTPDELVHLHGGTVHACSDGRDKRRVFTVRLPLHGTSQP